MSSYVEKVTGLVHRVANLDGRERILFWGAVAGLPLGWYCLFGGKKVVRFEADFNNFLREVPKPSVKVRRETDFDSFLKNVEEDIDERDPLNFDSFLKSAKKQFVTAKASTTSSVEPPPEERPTADHIKVTVMYGTEYGFSKEISEKLCGMLKATARYWSYTHYCRCGKQVDAALEAAGAARFVPRADINKEDWKTIDAWITAVIAGLPSLDLKTIGETGGDVTLDTAPAEGSARRWGKSRPYYARVVAVEGLCQIASKDDKDTVRVELDLGDSAMEYLPGDALGIYPCNDPQAVDELLTVLSASGDVLVAVPSWHYEEPAEEGSRMADGRMPLRAALTSCYDIRSPKPDMLRMLGSLLPASTAVTANGTAKQAKQNGSAAPFLVTANGSGGAPDVAAQAKQLADLSVISEAAEAYLEPRHVLDVLLDFPSARPSPEQLLGALRQLQPRLYSISSSPLENAQHVQATIAVVRYQQLSRERIGVCSTFVAERITPGSRLPAFISKNPDFRLPADPATPIIMVGPGTGLAPFRSFICQRLLQREVDGAACGKMVLYFGCRRRDQDFLYGDVLEGWAASGDITLFTAFSREQSGKVYVQQRLRESGQLVWDLLQQGAHFYVCGDAGSMAGAVEAALLELLAQNLGGEDAAAAAQAYLDDLSKHERYQRDVWY